MTTPRTAAGRRLLDDVREVTVYGAADRIQPGFDLAWHVRDGICDVESEAATAALESRIKAVADLIHETCITEWERRAARDPGRLLTLHEPDTHVGRARVVLGLSA